MWTDKAWGCYISQALTALLQYERNVDYSIGLDPVTNVERTIPLDQGTGAGLLASVLCCVYSACTTAFLGKRHKGTSTHEC